MTNRRDKVKRILELARNSGIVSSGEMRSHGIHHEYLRQLYAEGKLVLVGRGRYMLPDAEVTAHYGLAQAGKAVPKGVICLLSALRFHEIGADCFKYRNKIGLDVEIEALREVIRERKCTTDELWQYAKICRMTKTMRPYMEAIV